MYILYELNQPGNLPSWVKRYFEFWHFEVGYVDPTAGQVDLTTLHVPAIQIPDDAAQASRFAKLNIGAHGTAIKFRVQESQGSGNADIVSLFPMTSQEDLAQPIQAGIKKQLYNLTDADQANLVVFYQAVMNFDLNNHYALLTADEQAQYANKKADIQAQITACTTILQCQILLHNIFGMATHPQTIEQNGLSPNASVNISEPKLIARFGSRSYSLF